MIDRLRDELRKLFFLTRSEANGYLVLLILMALLLIAPISFDLFVEQKPFQTPAQEAKSDSLILAWENNLVSIENKEVYHQEEERAQEKPSLKQIKDYPKKHKQAENGFNKRSYSNAIVTFDLNKADTATLQKIYGIGPVLSERIVKFRDKLGGFYKEEQLYEVYGLDSATAERAMDKSFIDEGFKVTQIHLNSADFRMINAHPYISYEQTKAIVNYRRKHEAFNMVNDLLQNKLLDKNTFERVQPYLVL